MNDILHDFSPARLSQALDANKVAFWTLLFSRFPKTTFHDDPGMLWFETGIRHNIFNRVLQTSLAPDTCSVALERVIGYFQQHHLPFLWHLGPSSSPANLGSLLENYGMIYYDTEPGMAVDLLKLNEDLPVASQLTVHLVTTTDLLEQWICVWEFESSEELIRLWLTLYSGSCPDPESPLRLYLGMLDGEPVATSGVFFDAGVAAIGASKHASSASPSGHRSRHDARGVTRISQTGLSHWRPDRLANGDQYLSSYWLPAVLYL